MSAPAGVIAGQPLSVSVSNAYTGDSVSIIGAWQAPDFTFGSEAAGPSMTMIAPARTAATETFKAVVFRAGAVVASSASFVVSPTPTISVTSPDDFYAGYRVVANIAGPIAAGDRVRIDAVGQSDTCASCSELPATATVTFPVGPVPGNYQMRLLRSGKTVAVATFTTKALPTPVVTLWRENRADWGDNITPACQTWGGVIFCPYDPALIHYNPGFVETVTKVVTVTGHPSRAGDFIEIGNGGQRVVPNQWFSSLARPLAENETRYVGITYRTMLGGTDVPLGEGVETRWQFPVGGISCPVATPAELERLTGRPYDPNATIDGVKYCNTGQVIFLDPVTGQPLPAGQQPPPETPNIPATPAPVIGAPGAHWLEHGTPTDLKNASDWGCLANNGTTLTYAKPGAAPCLIIEPVDQGDGTWQFIMVDNEVDWGCLSWSGTIAALADPCNSTSRFIEKRHPGPGYLMSLSPATRPDLCLSSTLTMETCNTADPRQTWQDGPLDWLEQHKCAVALVTLNTFLIAQSCTSDDYKEVLKGLSSAVIDPVQSIIQCTGSGKKAKQCVYVLYAMTTPYPTQQQANMRLNVLTGMVKDCINNPERCIGEVAGNVLTAGAGARVKALAASVKAARAEAAAARAAGDLVTAVEKDAIAIADEAAAKGVLEEEAIFKAAPACGTPLAAAGLALTAAAASTGSVWCLHPFARGNHIHDQVKFTDYKYSDGWVPIGEQLGGYFPLIDFTKDLTVVSVKSVDASSLTALTRMEAHIKDLGGRGILIGGNKPTLRKLDIRIKPGQEGLLDSLKSYGSARSVTVTITVFP